MVHLKIDRVSTNLAMISSTSYDAVSLFLWKGQPPQFLAVDGFVFRKPVRSNRTSVRMFDLDCLYRETKLTGITDCPRWMLVSSAIDFFGCHETIHSNAVQNKASSLVDHGFNTISQSSRY